MVRDSGIPLSPTPLSPRPTQDPCTQPQSPVEDPVPDSEPLDPCANVKLIVSDPSSTRSLEIHPTEKGVDGLSCTLRLGSLAENCVALSYTWGKGKAENSVTVNGAPFHIRQNLWEFLQQESSDQAREGTRLLWIDALCINQTSIAEKNHQVALMGEIYTRTSKVIVWLRMQKTRLH